MSDQKRIRVGITKCFKKANISCTAGKHIILYHQLKFMFNHEEDKFKFLMNYFKKCGQHQPHQKENLLIPKAILWNFKALNEHTLTTNSSNIIYQDSLHNCWLLLAVELFHHL